ncbi:hypothetical protein GP486_006937 [Trichoglossum hirsutum]|uniref:DUF676 domain-containing protein n=1 Tax=Trichoglossum hirsutum TaxID=265104 RepID=A0A9P8L577_9PEZI|nr:hypothetical protein GP486_006937 [Trichoglossum hirsutum]
MESVRRFFKRKAEGDSSPTSSLPAKRRKTFPSGIKLLHDSKNSVVDTPRLVSLNRPRTSGNLPSHLYSIIFVHGLTGDREKTWTARGAASPWPHTLLPTRVNNARILTFGYDSYVADWHGMVSKSRVGDHSMNLLSAVATYRVNDDTALVEAGQRPEDHLRSILYSTRGILFLGTPHHGSGLAEWAEKLARSIGVLKQINSEIIAVLRRDSEVLARIQGGFHAMIRSRNKDGLQPIEITCFYEELPLPGVGVVVPSHSAILPGYIPIGIRGNHMDMTKFEGEDDPGFEAVTGELCRWIKGVAVQKQQEEQQRSISRM